MFLWLAPKAKTTVSSAAPCSLARGFFCVGRLAPPAREADQNRPLGGLTAEWPNQRCVVGTPARVGRAATPVSGPLWELT